ncbi:(deoxy)nucleoside triphosphate pyrophosphohydrolase [Nakamurella sp. YIM 132084]|uniref:8-oxo-dGTP diphosphatase n=2 Tax=Nakamurella leprariae TaxID=2803911 RepID=A0A939BZL8_9ACTN|nr:(deoxy)nucleoside triphosphate pyrophosphohydrolase [Nakamurella leprariae]
MRVRRAGALAGLLPGRSLLLRVSRDDRPDGGLPRLEQVTTPGRALTVSFDVDDTGDEVGSAASTAVTVRFAARVTDPVAARRLRPRLRRVGEILLGVTALVARQPVVVVAGAVLDGGGRVLAARRCYPAGAAGRWELPGGKVEPGETEPRALARELQEELGATVVVGDRLGPEVPLPDGVVLRCWLAAVEHGDPQPHEHAELRWLDATSLESVAWLDSDRALLPALRDLLS